MSPDKDILENCLFNSEILMEQGECREKMKEGENPTKPDKYTNYFPNYSLC